MILINPPAAALGTANVLLGGNGRQYHVHDFRGPLSIKAVMRGAARWKTSDGEFHIDENALVVLNQDQNYWLDIDSHSLVTTCCVFFAHGYVEAVRRSLVTSEERLSDDPAPPLPAANFLVRLIHDDNPLLARMRGIHAAHRTGREQLWLEEQVLLAARDLITLDEQAWRQAMRVPAARPGTRVEIYRRLSRAREYMHAHLSRPLGLDEIAREACLSVYHFHRSFKETFGQTPHQYLVQLRLDRATRLLASTALPVTEVCLESGFESLGSFSALFHRKLGATPRDFRRNSPAARAWR